ncbi:MAG: hypothetical protein ACRDS0_10085 [Pseudonocardiaceae bacterium]
MAFFAAAALGCIGLWWFTDKRFGEDGSPRPPVTSGDEAPTSVRPVLPGAAPTTTRASDQAKGKPPDWVGRSAAVRGRSMTRGSDFTEHPVFGLHAGMDRASVLDRLGPPTGSITMGEALSRLKSAGGSVVGTPPSDTEAWLYVDTPPGHEIRVTITADGRLERAEVYVQSSGTSKRIWSTDGERSAATAPPAPPADQNLANNELPSGDESTLGLILKHLERAEALEPPTFTARQHWSDLCRRDVIDFTLNRVPPSRTARHITIQKIGGIGYRAQMFGHLCVAVSVVPDIRPEQIMSWLPRGYMALLSEIGAWAKADEGEADVAHWVLCTDRTGDVRVVHLAYVSPPSSAPKKHPSLAGNTCAFVPKDLFTEEEKREWGLA